MRVQYRCPHCGTTNSKSLSLGDSHVTCQQCAVPLECLAERWTEDGLAGCLVCPGHELFWRKDFSQRLGVAIVITGFALSSVTWYFHWILWTYGILFATALLDIVLYLIVGEVLECYNCQAMYRDLGEDSTWKSFDLETHERYRQTRIRMAESASAGPSNLDR